MGATEKTFTNFTPEQAAAYAEVRGGGYPQPLYDEIFNFHGPRPRDAFLDIGTGPGTVVFDLLPHFAKGLGCDSSVGMIEQAKVDATRLGLDHKTNFRVSTSEQCAVAFPDTHVDLMTVAMAAHWFDMPSFYSSAAQVLRPGGTLAMWTHSSMYIHPSVPNHAKLQEILSDLELNMLAPHSTAGNNLSRNAYTDLPLPWHTPTTKSFEEGSFRRVDWDRHGVPSAPPLPDGSPGPFLHSYEQTPEEFVRSVSASSMVIRWREANPDRAHTSEDPVYITAERLRQASESGGKLKLVGSPSTTLLLIRRAFQES